MTQKQHTILVTAEKFKQIEERAKTFLVQRIEGSVKTFNEGDILYIDESVDEKRIGPRVVCSVRSVESIQSDNHTIYVLGIELERN